MEKRKIVELSIENVMPNRFQPRISFDEEAIGELSESIKKHGIIQPLVVRTIGDKYEIIAGERRYKASILAGLETVPAIVNEYDDQKSAEVALIENIQRRDLTSIEEAVSYKKILDMGLLTQTELAKRLGKEQSTIANKLRLLNLNKEVQNKLLDGKISERHARSLLKLDAEDQTKFCNKIIEDRLTVRKTDEEIKNFLDSKGINSKEDEEEVIEFLDLEKDITNTSLIDDKEKKVNPGFIDVDKIENEAKDIFEPQPEKRKVEDLVTIKEKEDSVKSNKFFSFIPDEIETDKTDDIYKDINFNVDIEQEINKSNFEDNDDLNENSGNNTLDTNNEDSNLLSNEDSNSIDSNNNFDFDFDFTKLGTDDNESNVSNSFEDNKTNETENVKLKVEQIKSEFSNVEVEEFDLGDMVQYIIKVKK